MTAPAVKTSFVDGILANDFNWPRTNIYVGNNAFDSSPVTGQRQWHNTRGLEYYWDGTRWLTVQVFCVTAHLVNPFTTPIGAGTTSQWEAPIKWISQYAGALVVSYSVDILQSGGATTVNYYTWSGAAYQNNSANPFGTIFFGNNSNNNAGAGWCGFTGNAVGSGSVPVVLSSSYHSLELSISTGGGTPGTYEASVNYYVRGIGV